MGAQLRPAAWALLLLAALAFPACGKHESDEVELGSPASRAARERDRIAHLERELAALKAHPRRRRVAGSSQGASGLRGRGTLLDGSDARSFGRLAASLPGEVGLTVGRAGDPRSQQLGPLATGKAWSTIKLPIAAAVLADVGGPDALPATEADLLRRAITASDNSAAASMFAALKARHGGLAGAARATTEPLRAAGDTTTVISTTGRAGFSPYGQTDWSLEAQHRFMARLAARCLPDADSARYLLGLMGEVVAGQRWGLGAAGVPARFKGGWGPGPDGRYLVRQLGVFEFDGGRHRVVVTLAAEAADGQFEGGRQILDQLARWAAAHVNRERAAPAGC